MAVNPFVDGIVVMLTGMHVPKGSSTRMRTEVEAPHRDLTRALEEFDDLLGQVTKGVAGSASGRWSSSYSDAMATFKSGAGGDVLARLRHTAGQLADFARETAYQIDYTNRMIVVQVAQFLFEWTLTLVLALFNPLQALIEQSFLRVLYRIILRSFLLRLLASIAAFEAMNVGLASVMDGLVRWSLAREGKYTAFGREYASQAVGFGAVQGAFGGLVPFAGSAFAGLLSKGLGRDVAGVVEGIVDSKVSGGADRAEGGGFARDMGTTVAGLARKFEMGEVNGLIASSFRSSVSDAFLRRFGSVAGEGAAREWGERWADAFLANFGSRRLGDALFTGLRGMESSGLRSALSHDIAEALSADWKRKVSGHVGDILANTAHQNVSEGFYTLFTTGRFATSWETGVAGVGAGALSHGLSANAHLLGSALRTKSGLGGLDKFDVPTAMPLPEDDGHPGAPAVWAPVVGGERSPVLPSVSGLPDPGAGGALRSVAPVGAVTPVEVRVEETLDGLEALAGEVGLPLEERSELVTGVRDAVGSGNWGEVGRAVGEMQDRIVGQEVRSRYEAFRAQADEMREAGGGSAVLERLDVPRGVWSAAVEEVEVARRSGELRLLDGSLRDYTALIERHVPLDVLTGRDVPVFHSPEEAVVRREVLSGGGERAVEALRTYLRSWSSGESLRTRLDDAAAGLVDPAEAVLRQRMLTAGSAHEAEAARQESQEWRQTQLLRQRIDRLSTVDERAGGLEESTSGAGPDPLVEQPGHLRRIERTLAAQDDRAGETGPTDEDPDRVSRAPAPPTDVPGGKERSVLYSQTVQDGEHAAGQSAVANGERSSAPDAGRSSTPSGIPAGPASALAAQPGSARVHRDGADPGDEEARFVVAPGPGAGRPAPGGQLADRSGGPLPEDGDGRRAGRDSGGRTAAALRSDPAVRDVVGTADRSAVVPAPPVRDGSAGPRETPRSTVAAEPPPHADGSGLADESARLFVFVRSQLEKLGGPRQLIDTITEAMVWERHQEQYSPPLTTRLPATASRADRVAQSFLNGGEPARLPGGASPAGAELSYDRVATPAVSGPGPAGTHERSSPPLPSAKALGKRSDRTGPMPTVSDGNVAPGTSEDVGTPNTVGFSQTTDQPEADPSRPMTDDLPGEGTQTPAGPWYTEHDMLGEATVRVVAEQWTTEESGRSAHAATAALRRSMPALATETESRITELLGLSDPKRWAELLNTGATYDIDGHLVWIRPVLTAVEPGGTPAEDGPVRRYQVRFNSTAAGAERSRTTTSASDLLLFTAINVASAAASAAILTAPYLAGEASTTHSRGQRQTVITGRKLFVDNSTAFSAAVRFRIFVDGHEHTSPEAITARGLTVDLPSVYTHPHQPRPSLDKPADAPLSEEPAGARLAGEVVNAIDLIPVIAHLQGRLRSAGLSARTALEVMGKVQSTVNERTARNRSRWWLTSGDPSNRISVGVDLPGLGGFNGHMRIRIAPHSLQFLTVTDQVKTREDLGVGQATTRLVGGESSASLTVGASATGWVDPSLADSGGPFETKGLAPLATLTGTGARGWNYRMTSQPLTHTILNTTEPQARYRATFDVETLWNSTTHRALEALDTSVQVNADVGVPWRDGRGAADFERRTLGAVVTPAVAAWTTAGQAVPRVLPGPVEGQPHVRALLRLADVRRDRSSVMPARLHPEYRARITRNEPLALASRRGLGYAVAAALPGAELVEDSLRHQLVELSRLEGLGRVDWAAVDRQISVHFGRPALEGDLTNVLAGVKHTMRVGNRTVTLALRGHLLDSRRVTTYPMIVNARAAVGESVAGGSDQRWAVQAGLGGAARVGLGGWFRLQLGAARLVGRVAGGTGEEFSTTSKTYRRMENTDSVDEHIMDIAYELSLRLDGDRNLRFERWWLERPDDIVAQVVVPHQHVPTRPVDRPRARDAGRMSQATRNWPGGEPMYDFSSGTSGLYPAFLVLPELPRFIVGRYAAMFDLPRAWADNLVHWPEDILRMTRPESLAAYFGLLTSDRGWTVELPKHDGWTPSVRLRLRGYSPQEQPATEGETEIEQYAQAVGRHTVEREHSYSVAAQAAIGPQFRFGSDQGNDIELADTHDHSDDGHHGAGSSPGGRVAALAHAEARAGRSTARHRGRGYITVTRATYAGTPKTLRSDAVFEINVSRSRGRTVDAGPTRYLRFKDAMDLLVPERRVEDLLPARTSEATAAQPDAARTGQASTTAATDSVAAPSTERTPQVARTYLDNGLLARTAAHPETLRAEHVLDTIERRLTARGLLAARTDGGTGGADTLRRALEAAFRPDALVARFDDLLGGGVWAWFPVKRFAGTTEYLWVRVSVSEIEAAHATRARPGVKLTLRGESVEEDRTVGKQSRTVTVGAALTARGGEHDTATDEQGHAGMDLVAGRVGIRSTSTTDMSKSVGIYRANTRDREGSHEFEHRLSFRVELGTVRKMPQAISSVIDGVRTVTGLAARAVGRADAWEHLWRSHEPWVWHEDSAADGTAIAGGVRLLVAHHMTAEAPGRAPVAPFGRTYGENPRWEQSIASVDASAVPDALLKNLHPWDVPAADAVNRWVKVAALRGDLDLSTRHGGPEDPGGTEFTSVAGLRYAHYTSHGMLRPRLEALLTKRYEVQVGERVVTVGFELTRAEPFGPQDGIAFKARRYRQDDEDAEHTTQQTHGYFYGGGPEGGGGTGSDALLGRMPLDRRRLDEEQLVSAASETAEHNQEGTRRFRLYRFDLRVVAQPATGPRRALMVDVPRGLIGMLPLDADGGLVEGLREAMPELFGTGPVEQQPEARSAKDDGQPRTPPSPAAAEPADTGAGSAIIEEAPALSGVPFPDTSLRPPRRPLSVIAEEPTPAAAAADRPASMAPADTNSGRLPEEVREPPVREIVWASLMGLTMSAPTVSGRAFVPPGHTEGGTATAARSETPAVPTEHAAGRAADTGPGRTP
ncbi:hypothetical protein OKJ48_22530 [Streptomyces kunmingensis]|uniref:Uncharacterized protein n=1 Tax=Streptomyces kunmingensis TaxID=68225 RepID=A0ABU6CFU8_9ACTN|nr:hypothetical protein [Streptomyces kunmingensis]MEB3963002.1 hypothetical protein [Streptomyces kunmingensis]